MTLKEMERGFELHEQRMARIERRLEFYEQRIGAYLRQLRFAGRALEPARAEDRPNRRDDGGGPREAARHAGRYDVAFRAPGGLRSKTESAATVTETQARRIQRAYDARNCFMASSFIFSSLESR